MNISMLRNLTDEELILALDEKRHLSPLIGLLCERLDEAISSESLPSRQVECPVCMAELNVHYDDANEIFELKPTNH